MSTTAVERCLNVVEALVDESAGVSLVDLAERLDMPNSAIHRTLAILASRGYVRQDPATQAYALTLRLSTLGFRLLGARHLPDAGQQVLQRLAEQTGEYCRLAVVEGDGLAWIARAQGSTQGLRYEPPMGGEVVLHTTATGKAWLATLPEDEALRIVVARGFPVPRHSVPGTFGQAVAPASGRRPAQRRSARPCREAGHRRSARTCGEAAPCPRSKAMSERGSGANVANAASSGAVSAAPEALAAVPEALAVAAPPST